MDKQRLGQVIRDQWEDFQKGGPGISRLVDLKPHFKSSTYVSVISGVRRCGKSTLLKQIMGGLAKDSQVFYLRLDDPRLSAFEQNDFETAYSIWLEEIRKHSDAYNYLFFDEVQNVEGWERWVDYFSLRPKTKVFVTGSNSRLLSSELSTFLTGRQLNLRLTPLSMQEILLHHFKNQTIIKENQNSPEGRAELQKLFNKYVRDGGFPRAYLDDNLAILPELYDDILRRDILPRSKRAKPKSLIELAQILAFESGRLFNRTTIAPIIGVSGAPTVGSYCQLFCNTFLFQEIRAFSPSLRKQLRSLSKFYCVDHALSREVGGPNSSSDFGDLEIMVFNELSRGKNSLFYWNSKNGYEVDFVEVQGKTPVSAVQVAHSIDLPATREREVRALIAVKKELGVKDLKIITASHAENLNIKDTTIEVLPFLQWANAR